MSPALSDNELKRLVREGHEIVAPYIEEHVQPASIDLRLSNIHYRYDLDQYVLGEKIGEGKTNKEEFDELHLKSGEVAFIGIYEKISIPSNSIGIVFPRSSITRLGIQIVSTYMNPGYSGFMPLTIINHTGYNITLKPNYRVAQLVLFTLNENPCKNYKKINDAKYFDEDVKPSHLHKDSELAQKLDAILEEDVPVLHKMVKESSTKLHKNLY